MARLFSARTVVLGGLAVAAAAAVKNRTKVAGLLGAKSSAPEPYPRPAEAPVGVAAAEPGPAPAPAVANADAAGPPSNTATAVPAPDPQVHDPAGAIDEVAEEQAAAAEAANIGGPDPAYAGDEPGEPAPAADVPVEESGEGVGEGLEQAEADLAETVEEEPPAPDPSSLVTGVEPPPPGTPEPETGDTLAAGTAEDGAPTTSGTLSGMAGAADTETSAAEKSAAVWRADPADDPESETQDTVEQPVAKDDDDDDGAEWQTWSGRAVEP
jgi:hypothetical protein